MNTVLESKPQKICFGEIEFTDKDRKRFEAKIQKGTEPDSCWIWTSAKVHDGYGVFEMRVKTVRAHRIAYELTKGPIPNGLIVCHRCDNRACVNPDHLFLGTDLDNIRDAVQKGRMPRGEGNKNSRLTNKMVIEIRELLKTGQSQESIGEKFGVHQGTISRVFLGKCWGHIN